VKALIGDLIGAEVARAIGLKVPEIVYAEVDPAFGRTEPDEEIQDLLKASAGLNLGIHYLEGAFAFDPTVTPVAPLLASKIVWLDVFLMNVDRTVRNTNLLVWKKELWLIDHGAALYFHHGWEGWEETSRKRFAQLKDHVLLRQATQLEEAHEEIKTILTPEVLQSIVALIPDDWLQAPDGRTPFDSRVVYYQFLLNRLAAAAHIQNEAKHAG
jgi:hypothetical protein